MDRRRKYEQHPNEVPLLVLLLVVAALLIVWFFVVPHSADAHTFAFKPTLAKRSLPQRAAGQRLVIWHDRQMIKLLRPYVKASHSFGHSASPLAPALRFHRAQLRWTRRELRETLHAIRHMKSMQRIPSNGGGWSSGVATWYGPGFYGHSPACGGNGVLTGSSMWAASMTLGCGTGVTICTSRCVHTTIEDTGAFSATFDLAPGLARALGCYCTQSVRYRVG